MRSLLITLCLLVAGSVLPAADDPNDVADTADWTPPPHVDPTTVIDLLMDLGYSSRDVEPNNLCTDSEFVRRIHLDLIGRIPTLAERERFLRDTASNKRTTLIDRLLATEEYAQRMAESFDVMLMGRAEKQLSDRDKHGWHAYLTRVFRDNRPWNDVAREVLLARGDSKDRGHIWFLYERKNKHEQIAEAVSRGFFGVDIACAQCHDHPLADEIEQAHYWGLVAFFKRSTNTTGKHGVAVGESAVGGFDEFSNALTGSTEPAALTFLQAHVIPEQRPSKDEEKADRDELYVSVENEPRIPHFSRRAKFVDEILKDHPLVARALVNRVWGLLMGRGIVDPVDEMDSDHLPSHPTLLNWLARDVADHHYDVRRLVRSIVRSKAYQLDSKAIAQAAPWSFAYALEKPLTAESYMRSLAIVLDERPEAVLEKVGPEFRKQFPRVIAAGDLPNLKQMMALTNHPALQQLFVEAGHRWARSDGPDAERIRITFLRVFGREATDEEVETAASYLQARADRPDAGYAQLLWALTTSAEFRFNH